METESLFANKLKLIINNLRFSKIIYISEKYNERIFYSLSNNFDSIRIIKHINHIKDFVSKEDLIILEISNLIALDPISIVATFFIKILFFNLV